VQRSTQLQKKNFTRALDETTNIKDTAQLAIFIRGVNNQMNVTEELLNNKINVLVIIY